ncbi:MAG: polysaccharide pyruvyl transferase family protein [Verrucomicrobia bacterium]|nr:polysaccharide pyruvyl transferase family protein [Verrucomicrobiota bacterium]
MKTYLKALAGQGELVYCPNAGNAGDSLIAHATFQLFERLGIHFELYDEARFDPAGKILIYGGGGSLVPEYVAARQFVERYHQSVKRLVILPHTISGHADLLAALGPNVDIFTREEVSFEYVANCAPHANVFLADDLALGLNVTDLLFPDYRLPYWRIPLKRVVRRDALLLREALCRAYGKSCVLNCFRTDKERTDVGRPSGNADLSKLFKCGTQTPKQALCATQMVFRFMNHYEEVRTNRLHLAIAGALLGKAVEFYPNSYYKCEAVYNFSMKDRFPNVKWMGVGS